MALDAAPFWTSELMTCTGHRSVHSGPGRSPGFVCLSPYSSVVLFINNNQSQGSTMVREGSVCMINGMFIRSFELELSQGFVPHDTPGLIL